MEKASENRPVRILVTGANGFVGRHLVSLLLQTQEEALTYPQGIHLFAAVHPDHVAQEAEGPLRFGIDGWQGGCEAEKLDVVGIDLCDKAAALQLIQEVVPDQVLHLAARASGADTDREAVFAVNVGGSRNLLDACGTLNPFPRVVMVSTGYVYGDTDPARPAREEDPVGPLWRYGAYTDSKIEMEGVTRNYRGFAMIARPFAHNGPGQGPIYAIPSFARQLARIEAGLEPPTLRVGNLEALRDILDVRDVVRAYALLMRSGEVGGTYNIALGRPVTIQSALDMLRSLCAIPTTVEQDPTRMRPADILCSTGDPLYLWTSLNWQPRYTLKTTLSDTLDYYRHTIARKADEPGSS